MAILKKVKKCSHCGSILQTTEPEQTGFIDPIIVKKYPDGVLLCNDCFKTEKIDIEPMEAKFEEDYSKILGEIKAKKGFIVYVVDLFSFEGCFITEINDLLNGLDVLLIGNKIDLMPANFDEKNLKMYLEHRLRMADLNVIDTLLVSSNTGYNIEPLITKIKQLSNGRDVFFIGPSTSGKSTIITRLLKHYKNETDNLIVTYTYKGTDIRGFRIPITNKSYIYEVPGTAINNSLLGNLERPIINSVIPKRPVKAHKVNLTDKIGVALGGLCFIQLLSAEVSPISIYVSDKLPVKTKRGDQIKFFQTILEKGDQSSTSYKFRSFSDFDTYDFEIEEEGDRDIGILGLGWLSFKGNKQKFRIFVPKGIFVYTTRAKIKYVKN